MSGAILGCSFTPNRAQDEVISQIGFVNQNVTSTLATALDMADQLASYRVPNLTFDISLSEPQNYQLRDSGEAPILTDVTLDGDVIFPSAPGAISPPHGPVAPFPLPSPPPDAPTPTFANAPAIYNPQFQAPPTLLDPAVPVYGDHTNDIPVPTPRVITLPPDPVVDLSAIHFQGVRPNFTATPPDISQFNYTETPYSPILVNELTAKIRSMIAGSDGITPIVEFQIWARDVEREEEQAMRAEEEAFTLWASRGFSMPNGMINRTVEGVRQNSQNQRNTQSRDKAIRTQEVLLDQLKFAVAQGVALEELWIRIWNSTQDRKLQAAKIALDFAIQIYNGQVALLEAEAAVYKVDADVYRALIDAELAKLQVYQAELEARRILGTLNQQDLDLYLGRLKAVDTNVAIYQAEVAARNGILEGEKLKLDQARLLIEEETAKLSASELTLRAWSTVMQGESIKQQAYATRAQIYTSTIGAWDTGYRADIARVQSELAVDEAVTTRFLGLVQSATAQQGYFKTKADIKIASNEAKLQAWQAKVAGDSQYNSALTQKMKSISDALRDVKDLASKNAEVNIQNILEASKLSENALATATQVLAQIASSFGGAVHVGAQISDSSGTSFGCNTSISQNYDSP